MIVYHLSNSKWALEILRRGRMKMSQIEDLNDPFELSGPYLEEKAQRKQFREWRTTMAKEFGMLCFSRDWSNPVLWSHYAAKHTGIALGFDIPSSMLMEVIYTTTRPPPESIHKAYRTDAEGEEYVKTLLRTKYNDWSYEDEVRVFTDLKDPDPHTGLYFVDIGGYLQIKEVIAGPLCKTNKSTIQSAVSRYSHNIKLIKSRLAHRSYRVVEDLRGFKA